MATRNAEPQVNPYATPQAPVEDSPTAPDASENFFAVTPLKLAIMSLTTFNLYLLYWFYKNWKAVQRITGEKLNAPIRAFFYVLVSYGLLVRIRRHAESVGGVKLFPAGALALTVFLIGMLWRLPEPYWLVSFFGFLPLIPAQNTVNEMNARVAPAADRNARFHGWNWLALTLGSVMVIMAVIGSFMPELQ